MIKKVINDFLSERKDRWLEPRLKKTTDDETALLQQEALEKFSIVNWLPDAARRAEWLSITTHPSKFTHTGARTSPVNAEQAYKNDGFLRSGNVLDLEADATGNAAAMDVHTFLLLPISETLTLLDAFEHRDEELQILLKGLELDFETLRTDLLKMKLGDGIQKTDRLLKQVYFPVSEGHQYHLLSLLTPSSMIWDFKKRIDKMHFSDETKSARTARRDQKEHESGYSEIFDLTTVGYGGTKPQVVSVLNSRNGGKSYLLPSIPPLFEKRTIRLPTSDFLNQSIYLKGEKKRFIDLHQWVKQDRNNIEVRTAIRKIIQGIIDQVLFKAYQLRQSHQNGWSESEYYTDLPKAQRIWLDDLYINFREEDDDWRTEIAHQIASHIISLYESINDVTSLGNVEFLYLKEEIEKHIKQDKEFF